MKIFCIGAHKTGTTSIGFTLKLLGYKLSPQRNGELLINDYYKKNYDKIFEFIKFYEVFQDTPFNLPNIYKILYHKYPDSKFILTIRDNSEDWYNSLINFHKKIFYKNKKVDFNLVKNTFYLEKNYIYNFLKFIYGTDDEDLYNKEKLVNYYENYNKNVKLFFKKKKNKLCIVNLSKKTDFKKMLNFLNINDRELNIDNFLHLNKT